MLYVACCICHARRWRFHRARCMLRVACCILRQLSYGPRLSARELPADTPEQHSARVRLRFQEHPPRAENVSFCPQHAHTRTLARTHAHAHTHVHARPPFLRLRTVNCAAHMARPPPSPAQPSGVDGTNRASSQILPRRPSSACALRAVGATEHTVYSPALSGLSIAQPVRRASDVPQRVGRAESACRRRAAARHAFGWRSPLRRVRGTHKPIRSSGLKLPCIAATLNLNSGGGLLAQRADRSETGPKGSGRAGDENTGVQVGRERYMVLWCREGALGRSARPAKL